MVKRPWPTQSIVHVNEIILICLPKKTWETKNKHFSSTRNDWNYRDGRFSGQATLINKVYGAQTIFVVLALL